MNVPVSSLGRDAADLLERVRAGEDVVLTDGGVPVARLSPVADETLEQRLARLEREGVLGPPKDPNAKKPDFRSMEPIEVTPGPPISDYITEMRRNR